MRVLVFGDSITYGRLDTTGGWCERLRHYYDEMSGGDRDDEQPSIYNLGISGDTAEGIIVRFDIEARARKDDIEALIIAIGANDSVTISGQPRFSEEEFKNNIEQIVRKAKSFSSKILLVGLLPVDEKLTRPIPWRPDRHYINARVKLFDGIIKQVATDQKISYLPLYEFFISKLNLFPDGLHPNNEGHQLIFELVQPELDKLLNT